MARNLGLPFYHGFRHPVTKEPTTPLPAQAAVMASRAKHIAYFGGYGSGKSTALGKWCMDEALAYPHNLGIIGRKMWPDLRDSTMEVFFRQVLPPEMHPQLGKKTDPYRCRWVSSSRDLIFYNGSKIMFRHMDDPERYRSEELGFFGLDEAREDGMEHAHKILSGRLRRQPSSRRSITVSNPGPKSSWLYRKFIDGMKRKPKTFFAVLAPSVENPYLSPDYLADLMDYPDEEFRMFVMGQFIAAQGAIFPKFRREVHVVRPFAIPVEWPKLRGIDVGISHPFVCLWGAINEAEPALYIYREWVARDIDLDQNCIYLNSLSEGEAYLHTVIDPATQARAITGGMPVIDQVRQYVDNVIPGFSDIEAGITRLRTLLNWNVDGSGRLVRRPKLYIFDSCETTIDQVEGLQYAVRKGVSTGKPVDRDDDCVDVLKYMVQSLAGMESFTETQAPQVDTIQVQCYKQAEKRRNRMLRMGRGRKSWVTTLIERALAEQVNG